MLRFSQCLRCYSDAIWVCCFSGRVWVWDEREYSLTGYVSFERLGLGFLSMILDIVPTHIKSYFQGVGVTKNAHV